MRVVYCWDSWKVWWRVCALFFLVTGSTFASSDSLTLLFVGDLMQHQAQLKTACKDGKFNYSPCFQYVCKEIRQADIAVGNLEVPLGGEPYTGYPAFCAPDEWLFAIRDAGFDVLLTANNHCLDRGGKGLRRTIHLLDSLKLYRAGTYCSPGERDKEYPLLVEKKGLRVVFLNYTYGTNGIHPSFPVVVNYIDRSLIRKDIMKARALRPDVIIACMHLGKEYCRFPAREERELAEWMIGLGVDHVIGAHPHVVQPVEIKKSAYKPDRHVVAYSLGNFISNMSQLHTDGGMMLKLVLERKSRYVRLGRCGYSLVWTSRPALSGKENFIIYPVNVEDKLLNEREKTRMRIFTLQTRELLQKELPGINEYFY